EVTGLESSLSCSGWSSLLIELEPQSMGSSWVQVHDPSSSSGDLGTLWFRAKPAKPHHGLVELIDADSDVIEPSHPLLEKLHIRSLRDGLDELYLDILRLYEGKSYSKRVVFTYGGG